LTDFLINMKLLFLIEKLESSELFQDYKKQNPNSYLCAGFFMLDFKADSQYQLDYSDEQGNITTFYLSNGIQAKPAETIGKAIPKKLDENIRIDIDNIEELAKKEAEKLGLKLSKIIALLQNIEGKTIFSLNCMAGLKVLKIKIDAISGEILNSELLNLFDFAKK